jgi:hypothetical protein
LATGAQVWQHSYSRTFFGDDATAIAISRDLTRVAVAGNRFIEDPDWSDGYATNLLSN